MHAHTSPEARIAVRPALKNSPGAMAEPVLLLMAEISGYTRFMTTSAKSLAHSQTIVSRVLKTLIRESELPVTIAKLEGDSILLYARREDGVRLWSETRHLIGGKLVDFFSAFSAAVDQIGRSSICRCDACRNISQLKLRVVAHSGEASFYLAFGFHEPGGADATLTRRLLKNTVSANEYLLLTERALEDLTLPSSVKLEPGTESYEEFGNVPTWIHIRERNRLHPPPNPPARRALIGGAARHYLELWWHSIRPFSRQHFHHIKSGTGKGERLLFALLMILLAPILVPVGLALTCARAAMSAR